MSFLNSFIHYGLQYIRNNQKKKIEAKCCESIIESAMYVHPKCLRKLIYSGHDINAVDNCNRNALYFAIQRHTKKYAIEFITILLNNGVDTKNSVYYAATYNSADILLLLLKYDADINCVMSSNINALHAAVNNKSHKCLWILLENGCNTDVQSEIDEAPIHYAIKVSDHIAIRMLLEYGAKIDLLTEDGDTLMHYAAKYNNFNCIYELISNGCSYNKPNKYGELPIDDAKNDICKSILNDPSLYCSLYE